MLLLNDMFTTVNYTLSLHDALPILVKREPGFVNLALLNSIVTVIAALKLRSLVQRSNNRHYRSEEHTSELQSQFHLVCRLLLEKKKIIKYIIQSIIIKNPTNLEIVN